MHASKPRDKTISGGEMNGEIKNSGSYKLKFLITPEEFSHMLTCFEQKQAKFHRTNHAMT